MSADQTAATYGEMGGQNNADTQQNITQYFATVPSGDLDVALDAEASSLRGTDNSQEQWAQSEERSSRRFRAISPTQRTSFSVF